MKSSIRDRTLPSLDHNQVNSNVNDVISSCIQIEESRISRRNATPPQIRFLLNGDILVQIEQAKVEKRKLTLTHPILADLQYYALLNTQEYCRANYSKHQRKLLTPGRSALTFSTDYSYSINHQPETLFRSVIDLTGIISQQIQQDLWQNQQLLNRIAQAHYWLIVEILAQLPLESKSKVTWLVKVFFLIIISLIVVLFWHVLSLSIFWKILILSSFLLFVLVLKKSLFKSINKLIIYYLIDGKFLKNTNRRRFCLTLLTIFK